MAWTGGGKQTVKLRLGERGEQWEMLIGPAEKSRRREDQGSNFLETFGEECNAARRLLARIEDFYSTPKNGKVVAPPPEVALVRDRLRGLLDAVDRIQNLEGDAYLRAALPLADMGLTEAEILAFRSVIVAGLPWFYRWRLARRKELA